LYKSAARGNGLQHFGSNTQQEEPEISNKLNASILHVCTNVCKLFLNTEMFHPSDFSGFVNEAVWSTAQRKLRANFREVAIVPFGEGKRLINTIAHHQCLNASISSYSLSFEGITWPDPTSLGAHQSTSSHDDKLFGLTQISQVFMNIDY